MVGTTAEDICSRIYRETNDFYKSKTEELGPAARGFRILYGPPTVGTPLLFIGYQPGGRHGAVVSEHERWPPVSEYTTADWRLACQIRSIWCAEAVAQSTGLNAVFFRSPSKTCWRRLPLNLRRQLQTFSLERVEEVVGALRPQTIVIIGIGTFDILTKGDEVLRGERRALVKRGELWGVPAFGVVHLSGAWPSRVEMDMLRSFFASGAAITDRKKKRLAVARR